MSHPADWHPRPDFLYEAGGGPLWDLAPYGLTALTMLFGPVTSAVAHANAPRSGDGLVPTDVTALLDFEAGSSATISVSYDRGIAVAPPLGIFGTTGAARFTGSGLAYDGKLQVCRGEGHPWTTMLVEHRPVVRGFGVVDLVDALAQGRPPRMDVATAVHVVEVIEALERSSVTGEPVAIPTGTLAARRPHQ